MKASYARGAWGCRGFAALGVVLSCMSAAPLTFAQDDDTVATEEPAVEDPIETAPAEPAPAEPVPSGATPSEAAPEQRPQAAAPTAAPSTTAAPNTAPPPVTAVTQQDSAELAAFDNGDLEEEEEDYEDVPGGKRWGQRNFGIVLHVLPYSGFGAGVRAGTARVGAFVSGAYNPIFVFQNTDLDVLHSGQVNAEAYFTFTAEASRFHAGVAPGYRYSTLLGHGGTLGFFGLMNFSRKVGLHIQAGVSIYPDAEARVLEELDPCGDVSASFCSFEFSLTPVVQPGVTLGLVIFP